ncbi:LytTR family DNA-binding domain-containing protein [uncultured Bacteroides sp.]|uniref:LytR/AlgR family response regulator transcription factor n=1 Tax=uncultured Bacteroides sp. TaxID=162156 RepID=UPI002AAB2336|nr:LytTR family DNA-binding domain-containing protein [uncultured Bacteroides sp.]
MTLNCCIIDDEPLALDLLESYVLKTPFLKLTGKYLGALQAMNEIQSSEVDLIFLDIQMPGLNGLDFSRMISEKARIIFTTAFNQYALDSYKVNALDYLLKPISYLDFLQAANKALRWFEIVRRPAAPALAPENVPQATPAATAAKEEIDSIFVKSDYKLVQVKLDNILYIEGLKDYIKICTDDDSKPLLSLMSIKSMEELLPSGRFMRVHRSFIVHVDKIKIIDRNRIVFGKTYIPVSDSYKKEFNAFLKDRSL